MHRLVTSKKTDPVPSSSHGRPFSVCNTNIVFLNVYFIHLSIHLCYESWNSSRVSAPQHEEFIDSTTLPLIYLTWFLTLLHPWSNLSWYQGTQHRAACHTVVQSVLGSPPRVPRHVARLWREGESLPTNETVWCYCFSPKNLKILSLICNFTVDGMISRLRGHVRSLLPVLFPKSGMESRLHLQFN